MVKPDPFTFGTLAEVRDFAKEIADSGMFGIKKPSQAITMLKLAHDEGYTLMQCLQRFHFFEDGKLSQRADWTDSDFKKRGWILWHVRTDEICAASFGLGKAPTAEARKRALKRFELQWSLEDEKMKGEDRTKTMMEVATNTYEDEATIIRTLEDAEAKGLTQGKHGVKTNWKSSPRQMLSARVVTEGVKVVDAGTAPFPSEDETVSIQVAEFEERKVINQAMTEKEKLEWMISEKIAKSELAGSPSEKSRLLGEAADLRTELHQKFPIKQAEAREIQAQPAAAEGAGAASAPETGAGDTQTTVEPPEPPDWRNYKIREVKNAAYKGKLLEELTEEEIELLYTKRGLPKLEDPKKEVREEARMIKLAYEHYQALKAHQLASAAK